MLKTYFMSLVSVVLAVILMLPVRAAYAESNESYSTADPRSKLSTIFYTGVGGAALGLSTLSFYGEPQNHLPNIAIGFAVGIIFGAGYVTVQSAHRQSTAADFAPAAEAEMAINSGRTEHLLAAQLTPAQWSWSF